MIIRIALLLFVCAILIFSFADVLLELALPFLPEFITELGIGLLLCAFLLIIGLVFYLFGQKIIETVKQYFSKTERSQRELLFIETKQQQSTELFLNRALKIRYLAEIKRKRLLKSNQRKHINALSKAINKQLKSLNLPKDTLKQLQQQNRLYRNQHNSAALLQLQKKLTDYEH